MTSIPPILMYHSISSNRDDPYSVSVESFERQVSWLSSNGFISASLSCVVDSIQRKDIKTLDKRVVFTFDDGYVDFVTGALPILLFHRATATVFIVTDMLGKSFLEPSQPTFTTHVQGRGEVY